MAGEAAVGPVSPPRQIDAARRQGSLEIFGIKVSLWETGNGFRPDGLFFQAGNGVAIGGQGSIDIETGRIHAFVALRLDF